MSAPKPTTKKLKDSCDKCSSSKIKCNKQRPVCGRCEKLGYTCFYSPSRRIGRPYRASSTSQPSGKSCFSSSQPTPMQGYHVAQEPQYPTNPMPFAPTLALGDDHTQQLSQSYHSSRLIPQFSSDMSLSLGGNMQVESLDAHPDVFPAVFTRGVHDSIDQAPGLEINNLFGTSSSAVPDSFEHMTSMAFAASGPLFGAVGSSVPSMSNQDCAMSALRMIQQLEAASSKLQMAASCGNPIDALTLTEALGTATEAFKCMTTILVCPCSERYQVGLLAGALCATMLEVHTIITSAASSWEPSPNFLSPERSEEKETASQIMSELAKLAKIVLQYTKRYIELQSEDELLPSLATFLSSKLQGIISDATESGWLA